MDKSINGNTSHSEAWQEQGKILFLGPCFDMTLSAAEAIQVFDGRNKVRTDCKRSTAKSPDPDNTIAKDNRCQRRTDHNRPRRP